MPAPLYFLPDLTRERLAPGGKLDRQLLAEHLLAEVADDIRRLDDLSFHAEIHGKGPNYHNGLLLGFGPAGRCGYHPDLQEWHPVRDGKLLWIGLDDSPTPTDLARREQINGHWVELSDGQSFLVPVIRRPGEGSTNLPRVPSWNEQEQFQVCVARRYQALWDDTARVIDLFFTDGQTYDLTWGVEFCLRVLNVNYRVDRYLQNVLQLLDTKAIQKVFEAAIDLPWVNETLEHARKKNELTPPG